MKSPGVLVLLMIFFTGLGGCKGGSGKAELILEPVETGSSASIRALHVVNQSVIWAGGSGGTFLLSSSGGESWKVGSLPGAEGKELRSIPGTKSGFVAGSDGGNCPV